MHCASHSFGVIETVRRRLKNEQDILHFQEFLQTVPNRKELCRVDEVFAGCNRIECAHCFRRVWQCLSELIGDGVMDENVATNLLGENPLKTVSECAVHEQPNVTQQPGFLPHVYDRIEMLPSFVPIGPRYTLEMFIKNLKVLLDRTDGLRADGKDIDVLETVIDEQNQVLGMLADCTSEFVTSVYKFEFIRPFREVHPLVYAFVALFEVLCSTLFDMCHKVRERFHRTNVPSVVGVNMPCYLQRFKEDVSETTYKGVLLSLHILNIQRLSAFRTFYTLACDQIVILEHEYVREMSNKFKYVDQMDFALPYKDMSIKMVLLAQLEMALGPLGVRGSTVEFALGRYPSVTQELGMLELRCSKIQEGHLDVWTRTKDRAIHQMVPEDFPMTPAFRTDLDVVLKRCQKTAVQFAKEAVTSAPRIDALIHTDPLGAMRQRMTLRASGLRALTDLVFSTMKVTGLAAFLHDYFPVLQEHVCGTDTHVSLFVRGMLIDAHVRMLFVEFDKYERERAMQEILELGRVQTAPQKNAAAPKQKKMSEKSLRKKKSEPVHPSSAAAQSTTPSSAVNSLPPPPTSTGEEEQDDDGEWEQVQSKKKSSVQLKTEHPEPPEPPGQQPGPPEPSEPSGPPEQHPEPPEPVVTEPTEVAAEDCEVKPKPERRRGNRRNKTTTPPPAAVGMTCTQPIDPLVLASYAASQVSEPVRFVHYGTVAVPARMFGGVLSPDYASVPFMTFPRVYM